MSSLTLGINYYETNDEKRQLHLSEAVKLFHHCKEKVISYNFENEEKYDIPLEQKNVLKRSGKDNFGGLKKVPYIKDILDEVAKENTSYIGYINSDNYVTHDFFDRLSQKIDFDCYLVRRFNISNIDSSRFLLGRFKYIIGNPKHNGIDCFIFKKEWWLNHRDKFPDDLLIAETHWDLAYKYVIENEDNTKYFDTHYIWHPHHDQTWNYKTKLAMNNIRIYEELTGERVVGDGTIHVNS